MTPEHEHKNLTLSPLNKLSSAKFLVCSSFQSASMSLKVGENVIECQTAWIQMRRRELSVSPGFKLFDTQTIFSSTLSDIEAL